MQPDPQYLAVARPPSWALPVGIFVLVLGLALVSIGVQLWADRIAAMRTHVRVIGEVVELVEVVGSDSSTYRAVFRFVDPATGVPRQFRETTAHNPTPYRRGGSVAISFPPGRPEDAALDTPFGGTRAGALAFILGSVAVAVSVWILVMARRYLLFPSG